MLEKLRRAWSRPLDPLPLYRLTGDALLLRRAGKDLNWYTKAAKHDLEAKGKDDMTAVKAREADLMAQMLYRPTNPAPTRQNELAQI